MEALLPRRVPALRAALRGELSLRSLAMAALAGGLLYGMVMGSYFESASPRPLQMLYSALKVPLLLGVTFALTLPSFFVLNTLLGLRDDFGLVLRALLGAQATLALVLASLSPYTLLFYASTPDYQASQLFNLLMFTVASVSAQLSLRRRYGELIRRDRRHRFMLRAWLTLFAFVAVQMAWVLRPFIGTPDTPTQFFREGVWDNAYVIVLQLIWRVLTGGG